MAEDESFGPVWPGLEPVDAEEIWRTTLSSTEPGDLSALLKAWSSAWDLKVGPVDVGQISTVDRLVVAGPSAVAAVLAAFVGRSDLAWSEQVTVVATPPAHRQLACFATAVLNGTKAGVVTTHGQAQALTGRAIVSADALPEDATVARRSTS